ncbi:hypothetical protein THIOSC15_2930014 [uncultured Thiomicrorhabdus sp.]
MNIEVKITELEERLAVVERLYINEIQTKKARRNKVSKAEQLQQDINKYNDAPAFYHHISYNQNAFRVSVTTTNGRQQKRFRSLDEALEYRDTLLTE